MNKHSTHSITIGYILWIFGFIGAHRFYYGNKTTGVIWFFTGGLCGIGWLIDLFLIPSLDRDADLHYTPGASTTRWRGCCSRSSAYSAFTGSTWAKSALACSIC